MNWKTIIEDLCKRGYSMADLARELNVTSEAIRALKVNPKQQPRYGLGDGLVKLHKKAMRRYPKIDMVA